MVGLDGEKMSKSLGNLVFVEDLLKRVDPPVARLALMSHHYREDWAWNDEHIDVADDRLESWGRAAGSAGSAPGLPGREVQLDSPLLSAVRSRLDDDLDVPGALEVIDEAAVRGRGADGSAEVAVAAALLGVPLSE